MSLKKSYIYAFFHSFWKNLHLTENFYTDMSVVSVTNKRYGRNHPFCHPDPNDEHQMASEHDHHHNPN